MLGALAVVLLLASRLLYTHLEGDFLPEEDKGRLLCFVIAPEGSTTEHQPHASANGGDSFQDP